METFREVPLLRVSCPCTKEGAGSGLIRARLCFLQASVLALVTSAAAVDADVHKLWAGREFNLREVTGIPSNLRLRQTSDRSRKQAM